MRIGTYSIIVKDDVLFVEIIPQFRLLMHLILL